VAIQTRYNKFSPANGAGGKTTGIKPQRKCSVYCRSVTVHRLDGIEARTRIYRTITILG
jgi:hypothetical protein